MSATETTEDLEKVLAVAKEAVAMAGDEIRHAWWHRSPAQGAADEVDEHRRERNRHDTKSSAVDLVTETDRRCEAVITERIRHDFPDHVIIGEESSGSERYDLTDAPTWTVDPIDGTTNFVHRLALSCVLVSFLVGGEVLVAVTYDPNADELFHATKGKGAYLRRRRSSREPHDEHDIPIRVSGTTAVSDAVVSVDPGYGRSSEAVRRYTDVQGHILRRGVRNVRVLGSTGLNMAYVACGRLDAAFELGSWEDGTGPKIWDFAAGKLLVEEAGGVTVDVNVEGGGEHLLSVASELGGRPLRLTGRSFFAAATPGLARELVESIGLSL